MDKLTNEMIKLIVNEYGGELKLYAGDFPQVLHRWKVQGEIKKISRVDLVFMHTSNYSRYPSHPTALLCLPDFSCLCECSFSASQQPETWSTGQRSSCNTVKIPYIRTKR